MHGVINFLKPPGMTSHDAVAFVRRVVGIKRVGHTGTLDPAAAGVLPICIGQATRLVEYLQTGGKEYIAEATFGYETDTLDAVGQVVRQAPASHITLESLRAALDSFRGTISQTPPLYSAIKQDGKKLYELARAGAEADTVDIKTRQVQIDHLFSTRFVAGEQPCAMLHIGCSGGTYIRSLVRDIGTALESAATMTFLVRTRSGAFTLDEAHTTEAISDDWQSALVPMTEVLGWCVSLVVTDDEATQLLSQGRVFTTSKTEPMMHKENAGNSLPRYHQRLKRAALNGTLGTQRVIFLNTANTTAVLAERVLSVSNSCYRPEKVFFLGRDN